MSTRDYRDYRSPAAAKGAAIATGIICATLALIALACCGGIFWVSGALPWQRDKPHTQETPR